MMNELKNAGEISYESVHNDIGIEYLIYLFVDYCQRCELLHYSVELKSLYNNLSLITTEFVTGN